MRYILIIILIYTSFTVIAQQNLTLVANVDFEASCNDVWGFVDQNGLEYAVIGTREATHILDISEPEKPVEVIKVEGATSTWRDFKSWGNYIYAVADQGSDGLLVIDMTNAPNNITHNFYRPFVESEDDVLESIARCHNLYADENGFIYLSGCNPTSARGIVIMDANQNPMQPPIVGIENVAYSHDVFVRNDTMFTSEIGAGRFGVYDVRDKSNPILLAQQITSNSFTHNAWTSEDGRYLFTTDERGDSYVDAYDISDLDDIMLLDKFRPIATQNLGVIPHNTHYDNEYLITSWYTDGIIITDVSRPDNMIQVGQYDTWDGNDGGFNGCWGAYPYLPSGLILASDISTGLYILDPIFIRGAFLEGNVRDEATGNPINGVAIRIAAEEANESNSNATGTYKTGLSEGGTFEVIFTHPEYRTGSAQVTLENGVLVILDIALVKKPILTISGQIMEAVGCDPIEGAKFSLQNDQLSYEVETDEQGAFTVEVLEDRYDVFGGAWGYKHKSLGNVDILQDEMFKVNLKEGYQDDFIFDFQWSSTGDAVRGAWERGVPRPTFFEDDAVNVNFDVDTDLGLLCYMTGNGGGSAGQDDIDNGTVILTSPAMDLSEYNQPIVKYIPWFYNGGGDGMPDDMLVVKVTNKIDTIVLESIIDTLSEGGRWRSVSEFDLSNLFTNLDSVQVIFEASDFLSSGHLSEAGIDQFSVEDGSPDPPIELAGFGIYPNPFYDRVFIEESVLQEAGDWKATIYSIDGRLVLSKNLEEETKILLPKSLIPAPYILELFSAENNRFYRGKIIKML